MILIIYRFGFEDWILVLIALVPGLCILFTFMVLFMVYLTDLLICSFGCFPFKFRGREFGSDCAGSWPLLSSSFSLLLFFLIMRLNYFYIKHEQNSQVHFIFNFKETSYK